MIIFRVYVCKHGHVKYSEYEPDVCNICGNTSFKLIRGITIEVGDRYGISRESEDNHS